MLSPWPSSTPRVENNIRNNNQLWTRTAALQRLVKTQNMSLRGHCPLETADSNKNDSKGKHGGHLRRRNPFDKVRKRISRKIRMPRGNTRLIDHSISPIEADNFDATEKVQRLNIIQTICFKDITWPWWCRLQKDRSGTSLRKESYVLLSCRILDYIMGTGEIAFEKLQAAAELDWNTEMEDDENKTYFMSQRLFLISMFKVAYLWSPTSDELDDIVQYLGDLYMKIKKNYGFQPIQQIQLNTASLFGGSSTLSRTNGAKNMLSNMKNNPNNSIEDEESTVLRWPLEKDGLAYSFGLRRPISASKDHETYPGPSQYNPQYHFLSHGINKKHQPGSHGASFGSGPKSFMKSMAFASIAGHVGFLNPPDPSGWPSPRREEQQSKVDYPVQYSSSSSNNRTFDLLSDDGGNRHQKYKMVNKHKHGEHAIESGPFQKRGLSAKVKKRHFSEKRFMDELKEIRKIKLKETPTLSKFSENTTNVEFWARKELQDVDAQIMLEKIKRNPAFGLTPRKYKNIYRRKHKNNTILPK